MKNWFDTLNESLESENLLDTWNCHDYIGYGETFRYFKRGLCISIYRDDSGCYERPVNYPTLMDDSH